MYDALERAKQLLIETDLPIAEVARLAGYSAQKSLFAAIKTDADVTPAKYRRRFQLR